MRKLLLAFATVLLIPGMLGAVLRGTFTPENELVPSAQEAIWGAIESLYVLG